MFSATALSCDHGVGPEHRCLKCNPLGTRPGDTKDDIDTTRAIHNAERRGVIEVVTLPVNVMCIDGLNRPFPEVSAERKMVPMATGLLDYFPDALAAVAHLSFKGNQKHNPGQPLHWSRDKSTDHPDCILRHLAQRGEFDNEGNRHSVMLAWRALANLQIELETDLGLPMSRSSKAGRAT